MLDVVRAVALAFALLRSARLRFATGLASALALSYGLGVSGLDASVRLRHHAVTGEYALGLVFLGTSAMPAGAEVPYPGAAWMFAHRDAALLLSAALALVPFAVAWRTSSRLSPHSMASRRWDGVSAPFLLLASIDLTLMLLGLLMAWLVTGQTT